MSEAIRDQLAPQGFTFRAADKGPEQFKIGIWNGRVDIAVFGGNGGAPIFKQGLGTDQLVMFRKLLTTIKGDAPGTKKPMLFQRWDGDNRKYVTDGTMILGKDEKQVIYFEFQFNSGGGNKVLRFDARCANSVSLGVEPMADSARSGVRVEAILWWIDNYAPDAMLFSSRKFVPNQGGNRSNSGGGGGNSGGGSTDNTDFGGESADF